MSLAGGTNAKDELLNKISKLEDAKSALQKEINLLNKRITEEKENCENLVEGLKKTEATQGQLGREMRECENRLSMIKNATADKEAQIKQMKEECLHQEELCAKGEEVHQREEAQGGGADSVHRGQVQSSQQAEYKTRENSG